MYRFIAGNECSKCTPMGNASPFAAVNARYVSCRYNLGIMTGIKLLYYCPDRLVV